ncbi:MDR family MFS transporter [Tomitella biformata]|uniref:MDR family MFS transporter n=1 Tax=Tomitella biformata TaxID=630403 RepID=UPI000466BB18|nr:MDR family MFS transporter [Tomitella biformata]
MTTTATHEEKQKQRGIMLVFGGLMLTMLLASLNQTVLSTALPTIVGELHGIDQMLWVITAFILASTIMMPVYGKLGDLFGRKSLLLIAIGIFIGGSLVGALAPDMTWLIVARVIQGIGGGGLMILSQATIADVVPARERGKYMGIMGGVFAVSSVAGPLLGGWFTEGPGWRWVFWINLPIGLLAFIAAAVFLRLPKRAQVKARIDTAGMAVLAVATTTIVLFATWGGSKYAWTSPTILALAAVSVAALVLFVFIERRAEEPVMPLHLFKDRNFNLTTVAGLLTGVAMFGALSYLPTYLQMVTGHSATVAGLLMIPMMGGLLVTSIIAGQYVSKTGKYKKLPIAGALILALGLFLLSTVTVGSPVWLICVYIAVMGVGLGTMMQLLVLIVQNSFPIEEVGTATASNNYFRQIGATLGTAVVGSVFTSRLSTLLLDRMPEAAGGTDTQSLTPGVVSQLPDALRLPIIESYNDALTPIFLYMTPLAIIAAIILCFVVEKPLATSIERKDESVEGAAQNDAAAEEVAVAAVDPDDERDKVLVD